MTEASLNLSLTGEPPSVIVTRDPEVSDTFWLELLAEWGSDGLRPGLSIVVPVERFLTRMAWFPQACRRHGISPTVSDPLREMLVSSRLQGERVRVALADQAPADPDQARGRLEGSGYRRDLRDFQWRDLSRLLNLPNGANFSVPGAGKTSVAYAVYAAERAAGRVERMLVVAPLSAFDAWTTEVEDCFTEESRPVVGIFTESIPWNCDVLVVNYHRLTNHYSEIAQWVSARPTMALLDEAHRMKRGWDGAFGSACLSIAFLAARRDILTGTPAPQSSQDLVALIDFLWPGQARTVLPADALTSAPPADVGTRVGAAIAPLFVRTRKSELGLADPQLSVELVTPDPLQWQIYQALRDVYAGSLQMTLTDRAQLSRMGQVVMYLLEAATNPYLLSAGSSVNDDPGFRHPPLEILPNSSLWQLLREYNQYETPAKFRHLLQKVHAHAELGRKTLVWSNFVRNLQALERMLARYQPAMIYGQIPSETSDPTASRTRETELARFRDPESGCMVLLANPAAMSEGVSLHHACHDAIYLDRTFNAGQYLQSLDRIHRLGLLPHQQTRITFLVTTGTIDEIVNTRIRDKATRLAEMMDDPDLTTMALPSDEDYGPAIDDTQDWAALFAHLRARS